MESVSIFFEVFKKHLVFDIRKKNLFAFLSISTPDLRSLQQSSIDEDDLPTVEK